MIPALAVKDQATSTHSVPISHKKIKNKKKSQPYSPKSSFMNMSDFLLI